MLPRNTESRILRYAQNDGWWRLDGADRGGGAETREERVQQSRIAASPTVIHGREVSLRGWQLRGRVRVQPEVEEVVKLLARNFFGNRDEVVGTRVGVGVAFDVDL